MKSFTKVGIRLTPSRIARTARVVAVLACAGFFTTACTDSGNDPGVLSTLVVSPNPATVAAQGTVQFTASGTDFTGAAVVPNPGTVVWSVANGGGSIDPVSGLFTAETVPGTYTNTVVATCHGISASATVIVTAGALATITVTPNPVTLGIGVEQTFTAVGADAFGNVVAIDPTWSVTAGGGTIPSGTTGQTAPFTAGNTVGAFPNTVRAEQGGIFGTATVNVIAGALATITVTPNPDTLKVNAQQTFTAVGMDAGGNVIPINPDWSVVNGGGTIPANTTGQTAPFTAGNAPGRFANTVKASQDGISGTATVVVTAGPVVTITVTPNPDTLRVGSRDTFRAVGRDADGNVVKINPTWSVVNGGGTIPPGTTGQTAVFTAGNTPGTFNNTVKATDGSVSGKATVTVIAGPLATITVTPNPDTLRVRAHDTFRAVGRDARGNVVPINPTWSVVNGGGTIPSGTTGQTAVFTAGNTTGTFTNTVKATQGSISGKATVVVNAPPPPASTFRVLANTAISCTNGTIDGDVGTFQASGVITQVVCPISNGTAQTGTNAAKKAFNRFLNAYTTLAGEPCDAVLTGTLAGRILPPGVYCFDNAATLTGVLTLNGPANGTWLFKTGTSFVGALTGTNFSVVMAGSASPCNVSWWVQNATTMTDSDIIGTILAGSDITLTRGTLTGNAWAKGDATITGTALTGCN